MNNQVEELEATKFLQEVIQKQTNTSELEWFDLQKKKLKDNFQPKNFYLSFSSASRFIRKDPFDLSQEETSQALQLRDGLQLKGWNLLQCVRTYFLLLVPSVDTTSYVLQIKRLLETADMEEQVCFYSALPLLSNPQLLTPQASEGIRTNITDVFDAIALHNPFPHDYLDKESWNQMVLKAVFMQRPLYRIYGADNRANPELARMLVDFAHERWAANRQVTPELWRFVGPFLNRGMILDLKKVLQGTLLEKQAGLLACSDSGTPEALEILDQYPEIKKNITSGLLNWTTIGEKQENL